MKTLLFLVGIALAACQARARLLEPDCGVSETYLVQERIANGTDAEIGSSPWMAYLHSTDNYFICAGSLVNHWFVLTAAHCLEEDHVLVVRLGEYDRKTKEQDCAGGHCQGPAEEYPISIGFRSRLYNKEDLSNDIAMFKLARRVEYKPHIKPICIFMDPRMKAEMDQLTWFTATGWGKTSAIGKLARVLQTLSIRRQDRQECAQMFGQSLASNQICAGNVDSNLCNGDSGGPVGRMVMHKGTYRFFQLGIASYTNRQCQNLSVFTDVVSHQAWIQRVMDYNNQLQVETRIAGERDEMPSFVYPK